jgi:hypothetical protein
MCVRHTLGVVGLSVPRQTGVKNHFQKRLQLVLAVCYNARPQLPAYLVRRGEKPFFKSTCNWQKQCITMHILNCQRTPSDGVKNLFSKALAIGKSIVLQCTFSIASVPRPTGLKNFFQKTLAFALSSCYTA